MRNKNAQIHRGSQDLHREKFLKNRPAAPTTEKKYLASAIIDLDGSNETNQKTNKLTDLFYRDISLCENYYFNKQTKLRKQCEDHSRPAKHFPCKSVTHCLPHQKSCLVFLIATPILHQLVDLPTRTNSYYLICFKFVFVKREK